ncbi:MAG TPA: response regulator [Myxococcales bacterium]|jgi:DNA-binding response OmpR family regulator
MQTTAEFAGSILIIDDDEAIRLLLERALTKAGHDVTQVADGESALAVLAKEHFDLLIVDYMLPGISGLDVLKMVRVQHPALMAILVTAHGTSTLKASAAALGVHAILAKPFGILEIVRVCDEAIRVGLAAVGRGSEGPTG